jgi:hypothetical protein
MVGGNNNVACLDVGDNPEGHMDNAAAVDVMVDIESLGTCNGDVILSIGAVAFDYEEGILGEFYEVIDIDSCLQHGLKIETNTLKWWMDQSDSARDVFRAQGLPLPRVLDDFRSWVPDSATSFWANGVMFDFGMLEHVYKLVDQPAPWYFHQVRDSRTMVRPPVLSHELLKTLRVAPPTAHNALDDARAQAETLINVVRFFRGTDVAQRSAAA